MTFDEIHARLAMHLRHRRQEIVTEPDAEGTNEALEEAIRVIRQVSEYSYVILCALGTSQRYH